MILYKEFNKQEVDIEGVAYWIQILYVKYVKWLLKSVLRFFWLVKIANNQSQSSTFVCFRGATLQCYVPE